MLSGPQGGGRAGSSSGDGGSLTDLCHPLQGYSTPGPGLSLSKYQPLRPNCCLCPSGLPSGQHPDPSHRLWGLGPQGVSTSPATPGSVLPSIRPPLLAQIRPPSDVSQCGFLSPVCVLNRDFFVEL